MTKILNALKNLLAKLKVLFHKDAVAPVTAPPQGLNTSSATQVLPSVNKPATANPNAALDAAAQRAISQEMNK